MAIEEPRVVEPGHGVEDETEALIREARRRTRKRWERRAVAAMAVAGGAAAVYLLVAAGMAVRPSGTAFRLTAAQDAPSPGTFALATSRGSGYQLGIYSARTGRLVRRLPTYSSRVFTGNGLAYSTDGRSVYYTLTPRHRSLSLRLMRLDVGTRRSTFVTDGAQPALNPAGSELAYAAFPRGLAVRNLRTGQTRTIALGQLDSAANLMAGVVTWLANASTIAVVPTPTAWDLIGKAPKARWCGTSQNNPVIVFVHVPPAPAALSARCVRLPGAAREGRIVLAPDPASASSVLAATSRGYGGTLVEQISQTGAVSKVVSIPDSLAIAFDARGRHLLYLAGHDSPTLIEATIGTGRAVSGQWRDRNIGVAAAAW